MTKFIKTGSKRIRKDTFTNTADDNSIITDRKVYLIVDHKHKPVFHKDGYLLIFYNKRDTEEFLDNPKLPDTWRYIKAIIQVEER